jgi:hypothetical protein
MEIGPCLPPHLLKKGKHTLTESEDTVEIGPSLPPHLSEKKHKQNPELSREKDVYGPALPPQLSKQKKDVPIGATLPEGRTAVILMEDGKLKLVNFNISLVFSNVLRVLLCTV